MTAILDKSDGLPILLGVKGDNRSVAQPPLKWAGGKRKVLPYLVRHLPDRWNRLHEPFVGGGAFFFEVAARTGREGVWATLTDTNERLVRTYRGVRDDPDAIIALLQHHVHEHCEEHYYRVREEAPDAGTDTEVAAWMIYLNRTGFNGLYRVNSKNGFNVPFGRYDAPVICDARNLRLASRALQHADLQVDDFACVYDQAQAGDLAYFDPPYVPLSQSAYFTAYTKEGFGDEDQERLRDVARRLKQDGVHVILSNHDTPLIRDLYAEGFTVERVMVGRAINSATGKRGGVAEVIIT